MQFLFGHSFAVWWHVEEKTFYPLKTTQEAVSILILHCAWLLVSNYPQEPSLRTTKIHPSITPTSYLNEAAIWLICRKISSRAYGRRLYFFFVVSERESGKTDGWRPERKRDLLMVCSAANLTGSVRRTPWLEGVSGMRQGGAQWFESIIEVGHEIFY